MFKEITSKSNDLSSLFLKDDNLNICTKKFLKRLNGFIQEAFKKIWITDKQNEEIEALFQRRKVLRNKSDDENKDELLQVEQKLADKVAKENYDKIVEEISGIECDTGGKHSGKLWQLRKKLCPKNRDPPTAMLDEHGNLTTSPAVIEEIALRTFKNRLENRPIKKGLENIRTEKEELCNIRLKLAATNNKALDKE